MQVYAVRWLLPVSSPPLEGGAVAVASGRIVACGSRAEVIEAVGRHAEIRDLGDAVLLPGLVNAHVHVELSWMGDDPPPGGDYVRWVRSLLERREHEEHERAVRAAARAAATMIARGTVAVGDVGNRPWVAGVLARSGLGGVVFHETYGFRAAESGRLIEEALGRLEAISREPDVAASSERLSLALAPHAPHTTSAPLLRELTRRARAVRGRLSIHVAESREELELLHDGSGPFCDLLRERGTWDEDWEPPGVSPVAYLDRLGLLSPATLAVHCVQLDRADPSTLRSRGVTVVSCPRSNRYLGVGLSPIPRLSSLGIPLALGTDSLASVEDLDLFAEMKALREGHPALSPSAVVHAATLGGARALGMADRLGTIEPGKTGRLVVVRLAAAGDDPLETVCSGPAEVHPLEQAPWEKAA